MKYEKEQILERGEFVPYADTLTVLLEDDKEYSLAEVDKILKAYLKKEVGVC